MSSLFIYGVLGDNVVLNVFFFMQLQDECYVFDGFCGANPKSQRRIRFVHEMAWQQHFVTNMFIRANHESDLQGFEPDFTVINACSQVNEDWKRHGLNSEVAVVFNVVADIAYAALDPRIRLT